MSPEVLQISANEWGLFKATPLLIKEMVKLISLNIVIREDCVKVISDNASLNEVKLQCKREIEKMKKDKFPNTTVSYFSFFQKGLGELASLAANENIIRVVDSEDF